jgi:tetratricopeptide (TPR) repeat protein
VRAYQRLLEHRYDAAISEISAVVAAPPQSLEGALPQLLIYLGIAQQHAGHAQEAKASFEQAIRAIGPAGASQVDDNVLPSLLALAEAGNGLLPAALAQAHRGVELFRSDALHAAEAYETLAEVEAANGDTDAAFATLTKVQQMPARSTAAQLRLDPAFDTLRRDPRFNEVIAAGEANAKLGFLR